MRLGRRLAADDESVEEERKRNLEMEKGLNLMWTSCVILGKYDGE